MKYVYCCTRVYEIYFVYARSFVYLTACCLYFAPQRHQSHRATVTTAMANIWRDTHQYSSTAVPDMGVRYVQDQCAVLTAAFEGLNGTYLSTHVVGQALWYSHYCYTTCAIRFHRNRWCWKLTLREPAYSTVVVVSPVRCGSSIIHALRNYGSSNVLLLLYRRMLNVACFPLGRIIGTIS